CSRLGWARNSDSKVPGVGRQAAARDDRAYYKDEEAKRRFHGWIPLGAGETSSGSVVAESGDSAKPTHAHSRACILAPDSKFSMLAKITYLPRLSKQFRQFLGRFSFT